MKKFFFIIFSILLISCNKEYSNILPENEEQKVILDLSHLFSSIETTILSNKLIDYELSSTNEIAILTVDSILPYTNIQNYATDVANSWGIGKKEKDNGLIIVISKLSKQVSIATGKGTQKIITDSICKNLIETTMIPHFKNEDYYLGIKTVIDSVVYKWN